MCFECEIADGSKRTFLKTTAAAVAGALLGTNAISQEAEPTIPVALNDPNVIHMPVTFKISEDIRNTAAQMAQLGYVGLAMDWNSRAADSSKLEHPIEHYMTNSFSDQMLSDTQASIGYLTDQKFVKGKTVGAVGFCGGGYIVLMLATRSRDIAAAVNFYGPPVFYPPRVSTS